MKEEKLFEIVNNVDDELICEMLDYGADTEKKGEEYEGTLYYGPVKQRKIHYWKYPVTAAALMLVLVGALFIFNANNTLPYNEEEQTGNTAANNTIVSDLLHCKLGEDGKYRVDEDVLAAIDDYDLFRQYFFGTWDGSFCLPGSWEQDSMVIDDSLKSFNMNVTEPWFSGFIYKISDNVLAFTCGCPGGPSIHLVDMNAPETMYIVWGDVDWIWGEEEDGSDRIVYSLKKTDIPPNEPEENFLSIFRLHEISRDYGIDFSWLTEIYYDYIREDGEMYRLVHNATSCFYPVYLVSQSPDKFEFRTTVTGDYYNIEAEAIYTAERVNGEWTTRTQNFRNIKDNTSPSHALDLLHCRIDEEGRYRVDDGEVTESDDYDLFRKYFFGAWDGSFSYYFLEDAQGMIIDDSLNSFNMQSPEPWYTGNFYRIGDSTLSFITGSMAGGTVFWLDMNDPETMYSAGGGFGEHNWLWPEEEGKKPAVSVLKKTDLPPNEPEDNFMSIFKLREISRDYGIDIELLTDLGFEYYGEDGGRYWLAHDYMMCFYPVYLVSQSPDKFEFTATVTGSYDDVEAEAYYTIEKINGEWIRTEEGYRNVKDNVERSRALNCLRCWRHEDGLYRVDQDVVTAIDDYDLFRKYFFGTWEGKSESERMVIDDSLKSFNMNQHSTWYSGLFYRIGDNTYAFVKGGGEPMVYWLNTLYPDTMYAAYGEVEYWLKSTNEDKTAPEVYSLKKTSAPPNKPEENFLSIFRLHEISQDYGIDFDLLVDMEFISKERETDYLIAHNDNTLFYPVYLVSESADRLDLKTTLGNGFDEELNTEVSYAITKSNGIWTRMSSAEITMFGIYDRSALVDFDYSEILAERVEKNPDGKGDFLNDGYSEFKELYQKAYALTSILVSSPDNFPDVVGLRSPTVNRDDVVRIEVVDPSYPMIFRTYYLTGYSWDSFYNEMLSVFTKEQADELIFGNKLFYKFNGALWCADAATGGDMTRVHTEYAVEKTDDVLDIIRTTYHVPLGETPKFDPEKIDEYETKETHFTFIRFKDGSWRASEFADVR